MGVIDQAKDLVKMVNQINEKLYICNDILDKLDHARTISMGDRYLKEHGYLYAEISEAIKSIVIRHIGKLACELDELDKQDIICDGLRQEVE